MEWCLPVKWKKKYVAYQGILLGTYFSAAVLIHYLRTIKVWNIIAVNLQIRMCYGNCVQGQINYMMLPIHVCILFLRSKGKITHIGCFISKPFFALVSLCIKYNIQLVYWLLNCSRLCCVEVMHEHFIDANHSFHSILMLTYFVFTSLLHIKKPFYDRVVLLMMNCSYLSVIYVGILLF